MMSGTLLIMTLMGHLTFCENKVLQSTGDKENKKDTKKLNMSRVSFAKDLNSFSISFWLACLFFTCACINQILFLCSTQSPRKGLEESRTIHKDALRRANTEPCAEVLHERAAFARPRHRRVREVPAGQQWQNILVWRHHLGSRQE